MLKTNAGKIFFLMASMVLLVSFLVLLGKLFTPRIEEVHEASSSHYDVIAVYGATGNGATDDTAAIQNAINDAEAAGGGVVFFPKGIYKISSTLTVTKSNVQLEGTGSGSIVAMATSTGAVIKIGDQSTPRNSWNSAYNTVKNLTIDRSVPPDPNYSVHASYGIFVEYALHTTIDSVNIFNAGYGIAVGVKGESGIPNQFTNIVNSNIRIQGSKFGTTGFPGANIVYWQGADHKLETSFLEPTHIGVYMTEGSNAIQLSSTTIINGGPYNYGVIMDGDGFARYINNCIIENALYQQIYMTGSTQRNSITNNWIGAGDINGTTRVGIQVDHGVIKTIIANNRIGHQRKAGIQSSGSDILIQGNILEENVTINQGSTACSTCDSMVISGGVNVTVTDNIIASAWDRYGISIAGATDNFIVTGNNTSGSLNNSATGSTFVVNNNL